MKRIRKPETIEDACKYMGELIKTIAQDLNQEGLFGEVHLGSDDDWSYDSVVILKIGMRNGGIYDTGYCISPCIEEQETGLTGELKPFVKYYVQHEEIIHGTRYYPDGSGEPDASEVVDDFVTDDPIAASIKVVMLNMENELNHFFEGLAEQDAQDEWDKQIDNGIFCYG